MKNKLFSIIRFTRRYPLSLLVVAAILFLSFFKPPQDKIITISNIDKLAHFCMYAGFCSVVWWEYFRSHKSVNRIKGFLFAVVAPIIFGGVIEVAQGTMTVYRGMDWYDFIFNSIGVIFALFFAKFILRPRMRKYKENMNSGI